MVNDGVDSLILKTQLMSIHIVKNKTYRQGSNFIKTFSFIETTITFARQRARTVEFLLKIS